MDFLISQDQQALVAGIRDFLAAEHGVERLRALDTAGGQDYALWPMFVEMGLPGLLVPEAQGGLGLDLVTGALVGVELGRAGVSGPIADTALIAAPWLHAHGEADWLARVASGEARIALAHPANPWIADLEHAAAVIGGGGIFAPPATLSRESVDPLRRLFAPLDLAADPLLLDLGALMAAAQLLGAAEAMLEMAVAYARMRRQFGQPIGAFQAVKHHLASVAMRIEFARPVLLRAAQGQQDRLPSAALHISHAKLVAGDAAISAAETAIQVHGAMGYTYEVDLHFWMKRGWALQGAWGDRNFHLRRVQSAVIDADMPIGPTHTFA